MSQVSQYDGAANPVVRMKFTLPGAVPHGGRNTGSALSDSDGLTRRRFAAMNTALCPQHRNRGHPVMFVLVGIVAGYPGRFADLLVTPALPGWRCHTRS